ncbi:MAG: hemolysin family protein [Myxococcaceae bacterium]
MSINAALWVVGLCFLGVRALIAAAESALYGTSDLRAKELSAVRPTAGRRVLRLKTEREETAAAFRFGMVLSGFLAAAIGAMAPPRLLQLTQYGSAPLLETLTPPAGAMAVAVLASLMDVGARALASSQPETWALRLSFFARAVVIFLLPIIRTLVAFMNLIVRPFGGRIKLESPPPPLEELEKLLAAQAERQQLDRGAPQLIRSIFELSDKRCRDVMVPRMEVIGIDLNTPTAGILQILAEESHSRMPVYKHDPDHLVGILHVRDLIPLMQHPELIKLPDLIRPAHYVPWMKPIGDLLREMQRKKIHMAIVVDEYGGFMGLVTLEDILREIVGDIGDEFEVDEKQYEKQPDGSFLVDASLDVAGFSKAFGFSLPEGEYETLGGFLSSLAGSIPEVGERFAFNGWQFIVHSKEGPKLDRIRLIRPRVLASKDAPATTAPAAGAPKEALKSA